MILQGGFGPSVGFTETESISMGGGFGGPFGLGGGIRETETISVDRGFGGPFGFGGGIVEQETISMGGGLGFGGIGFSETESVSFVSFFTSSLPPAFFTICSLHNTISGRDKSLDSCGLSQPNCHLCLGKGAEAVLGGDI